MSSRKKSLEPAPIESVRVKLKPILDLAPRTYVPVIWAVLLVMILFLLLILPGIRHNGTYITFRVLPADASIIVDGVRLGASDERLFVLRGSRLVRIQRPGFVPYENTISVKGRLIASKIFPRREERTFVLVADDGFDPLHKGIEEFALWSATGRPRERYALPPVLTIAGREAVAAGMPGDRGLIDSALPLALDERHLADILRADYLYQSNGAPVGLTSIADYIANAVSYLDDHPGYEAGIADMVKPSTLTAWDMDNTIRTPVEILENLGPNVSGFYSRPPAGITKRIIGGISMIGLPRITAPIGDIEVVADGFLPRLGAVPAMASVTPFLISATEVSNADFFRFVAENPQWSLENRGELTSQGLADETYLSSWGLSGPQPGTGDEPVTWVSWFAAEAYAEWFTAQYLSNQGITARLPTEDEWEIAARYNGILKNTDEIPTQIKAVTQADSGTLGLWGMAGSVREWCSNPFRYNENRFRDADGVPGYRSVSGYDPKEKAVRGGSYIDSSLPYPVSIRGGLDASQTSPVVGFRLAAVQDERS